MRLRTSRPRWPQQPGARPKTSLSLRNGGSSAAVFMRAGECFTQRKGQPARAGISSTTTRGLAVTTFRRILVKLSGEALMAPDGYWLDPQILSGLADDLANATRAGFEIAVVIG